MTDNLSDFLVFVDESGDHGLEAIDKDYPLTDGGSNAFPEKQKAPTNPPKPLADQESPVQ